MAPMFLVSDETMLVAADRAGISGAIPALNWRSNELLDKGLGNLVSACSSPFGVNLIVNKSNPKFHDQLEIVCGHRVGYIITSLGNPAETISRAHARGIRVFCDVTNLDHALKVQALGADAVIAVNREAGGHAGPLPREVLLAQLRAKCQIPIISAGGVATYGLLQESLALGAAGVSVGTVFIATHESPVSEEYKQACVTYGAKDIVMTTKLSGTPCTVINTPYVEEIGTGQTPLERLLHRHKSLKKWAKALTFYKGMKALEKAAFSATYKTVWCAGPSIAHVHGIRSIAEVVHALTAPPSEYQA